MSKPAVYYSDSAELERFTDRIERVTESGCWIWIGVLNHNGYGVFSKSGRRMLAHRYAYQRFNGAIPQDLFVCHHCDVPSCVNPSHLFVGTNFDNVMDMHRKGRARGGSLQGEINHKAKLNELAVRSIRNDSRILREIAADHGITLSMVSQIKRRLSWSHIS